MKLTLFRHPEPEKFIIPGTEPAQATNNPRLSDQGKWQLKNWLGSTPNPGYTHIYCSPLVRSWVAAHTISKARNIPYSIEPGLAELAFPREWEQGDPAVSNKALEEWHNSPYSYQWRAGVEGGESFDEHRARVEQALFRIISIHEWDADWNDFSNDHVMLVGHRHTNSVIIGTLLGHRGLDHPYHQKFWTSVDFERRTQGHWEMTIG